MSEETEQPSGQRFFQLTEPVYSSVRENLDSYYNHPKVENGVYTESCIPSAEDAPKTQEGMILVSLGSQEWARPEVLPTINYLIDNGQLTEITQEQYFQLRQ